MSDEQIAYYAKFGLGLVLLSFFTLASIYIIIRKRQLDAKKKELAAILPDWLLKVGQQLGAKYTKSGLVIRRPGIELYVDANGTRLTARGKLAEPPAGSLQIGAKEDDLGPLGELNLDPAWQVRGLPELGALVMNSDLKAALREGIQVAVGPAGVLVKYRGKSSLDMGNAAAGIVGLALALGERLPRGGAAPAPDLCTLCGAAVAKGCVECPGCKAAQHHACREVAGRCMKCGR